MAVSKCPCLTLSAAMSCLDCEISFVPSHQLMVLSTLLAPAKHIPTDKVTKIHTLTPLTDDLFFKKIVQYLSHKWPCMVYMYAGPGLFRALPRMQRCSSMKLTYSASLDLIFNACIQSWPPQVAPRHIFHLTIPGWAVRRPSKTCF